MWRSLFLAVGIMLIIVGIECLMIDSATIHKASETRTTDYFASVSPLTAPTKSFSPSEWHPWSLMGAGTLTVLYSLTIRRKSGE